MKLINRFEIIKIKKITKAEFFKDLKVGDVIDISLEIKSPGRSSNGLYSTNIDLECGKLKHTNDLTQLAKNLANFELQEYIKL